MYSSSGALFFNRWLVVSRSRIFTAVVTPCIIGVAVAFAHGFFSPLRMLLLLAGLILAESVNMLLADWTAYSKFDISRGRVRPPPELPGSPLIPARWLSPKYALHAAIGAAVPAMAILIFFAMQLGWPILALLGIATVSGVFYAAPPFRRAFFSTAILPPVVAFGTAFVMAGGEAIWSAAIGALPVFFMSVGTIYTYRLLYQSQNAAEFSARRHYLTAVYALGYVTLLALVLSAVMPPWTLLALLPAPLILVVDRLTAIESKDYLPATSAGVLLHTATGLLIAAGYAVTAIIA